MESKYKIRDTGIDILEVLKLLAKGLSPNQIITQLTTLTHKDIMDVAQQAHNIVARHLIRENYQHLIANFDSSLTKLNQTFNDTINDNTLKWQKEELDELKKLCQNNAELKEIARIFKRSELAVKIQLDHMGLSKKEKNK